MATWYIKNGDLPYLEEFPDLDFDNPISDYPNTLWRIKNGELPYKTTFPELKTIDDYPASMWIMKNGQLPYKTVFPPLYAPVKEKVARYKKFTIKLRDYKETIIIKRGV